MVCAKCEKKVTKNAPSAPDPWKAGASNTMEGGGRKINENKMLSKKGRYTPYGTGKVYKCSTCKSLLNREGLFCHNCAYTKACAPHQHLKRAGVCEMCGVEVLENAKSYKQSKK